MTADVSTHAPREGVTSKVYHARKSNEMKLDLWLDHVLEIAYPGGYGAEEAEADAQ